MDYQRVADQAIRQIADKGRSAKIVYKTQGTYNATTDTISGAKTPDQTRKMVFINFKRADVDGTLIKRGDKYALLGNDKLTRAPTTADLIVDGTDTYTIVDVEDITPGDLCVLYKLHLRK